jgi:hypothetical protein
VASDRLDLGDPREALGAIYMSLTDSTNFSASLEVMKHLEGDRLGLLGGVVSWIRAKEV